MDSSYYTDEMRQFVASLDNVYNFPVDIAISEDQDGPFLVLAFKEEDHQRFGEDRLAIEEVATYLVDLRNGLIDLGARVTFVVLQKESNNA